MTRAPFDFPCAGRLAPRPAVVSMLVLLSGALLVALLTARPAWAQGESPPPRIAPHAADHILVKLEPGSSAQAVVGNHTRPLFDRWLQVPVPPGKSPDQLVADWAARPGVETASVDHLIRLDPQPANAFSAPSASSSPNDEFYPYQWHFPPVQLAEAWDEVTGSGVVVAVIDTGISPNGEDGFKSAFVSPYNAITDASGPGSAEDDNGHGTHVAGTVAQHTNNGAGVAGVAFDAELMPVKVLNSNGEGSASTVARGIHWARNHGAHVINLSLGFDCGSMAWPTCSAPIINDAIEAAANADIVVVAAAGNSGQSTVSHPANHPAVMAVGAVDYGSAITTYSNTGEDVAVVAPGGDLARDLNEDGYADGVLQETFVFDDWGYWLFEGTSMATPHVAGAAALLRARNPGADRTEIRDALQATALDRGSKGCDSVYGQGMIQIADALEYLTGPDTIPPSWPAGATLAASDVDGTRVTLTWPESCPDAGLAGYHIFLGGNRIETLGASTTSTTVSGLDPATSYGLAVRAVDSNGNVGPRLSTTVRTLDTLPPSWPDSAELDVVRYGETELTLAWSAARDNVGVTTYQVRKTGSSGTTTTERQSSVSGLEPGSEHAFQVLARDADGNWSDPLKATVRTARVFLDTADNVFYHDILWLSGNDITRGCNPPTNDRYCPDDSVTRGQMAAFLVRALGLSATGSNHFRDDDTSVFEADIGALAASGITRGCNPPTNDRFCPDDPVTRGQMAAFLTRALQLPAQTGDTFEDDSASVFETDIEALAASGITRGCNPPANDRFCPDDSVTRGQMAAFLARALAG